MNFTEYYFKRPGILNSQFMILTMAYRNNGAYSSIALLLLLMCYKLIAKVKKGIKNSDMDNFVCNQYGEGLAIVNTENIKICG